MAMGTTPPGAEIRNARSFRTGGEYRLPASQSSRAAVVSLVAGVEADWHRGDWISVSRCRSR